MKGPLFRFIRTYAVLISCWCAANEVCAQTGGSATGASSDHTSNHPPQDETSLIDILDKLEHQFDVSFAYQKRYLAGKSARYPSPPPQHLETYLAELLKPYHLTFRRIEQIREPIYVIAPDEANVEPATSTDSIPTSSAPNIPVKTTRTVQGVVTGGDPAVVLAGVNVRLGRTGMGTMGDAQGRFTLEIPSADTTQRLVFSHIGYETREVPFQERVQVHLEESVRALSEVLITALGIGRATRSLGYSATQVEGDVTTASASPHFASALYGKVAGVRIRTAPGGATSAVTMQIRGLNSLNYSTQPLYIVDGVIMRDGNEKGAEGINNDDYFTDNRIRGNGALDINNFDIASLTILKGAGATALYGSDASSGVVVITTKNGAQQRGLGLEMNYQLTREQVAFLPKYQNIYGPGFDRARNLASGATAEGWVPVDVDGDGQVDGQRPLFESYAQFGPRMEGQEVYWWDGQQRRYTPQPNNVRDFYRDGYSSVYHVALSNRVARWSYHGSYTRRDYAGTQVGGKMGKNTLSIRTTFRPNPRLMMDFSLNYVNSLVRNRPLKINRLTSSWNGFFSRAEKMDLFFNKYQTTAGYKWVPYDQASRNPAEALRFVTPRGYEVMNILWQQQRNTEDEWQNRIMSSFTLEYSWLKNLRARMRVGNDFTLTETEARDHNEYPVAYNSNSSTGAYRTGNGRLGLFYADGLLSYEQQVKGWKIGGHAAFQLRDEHYTQSTVSTSGGLVVENWFSLENTYNARLKTTATTRDVLKYAMLGMLNVSYRDRYFMEITGRQEYTSTLPPGRNHYFYPSINTGYIFSDVLRLPSWWSYGKLRAALGVVGNAPPAYESNVVYTLNNLQTSNGYVNAASPSGSVYGNNHIKPERKVEMEWGLDTHWFDHRLSLDIAYFSNRTYNQILRLDVPVSTGAEKRLSNVGVLGGQGWEISAMYMPRMKRVSWSTQLNFAYQKTRLISLKDGVQRLVLRQLEGNAIQVVAEPGQAIGNIYVHPLLKDAQGRPVISDDGYYRVDVSTYQKAGNLVPKVTGGLVQSVGFKHFSLDINLDYSLGGQIISPSLKYGLGSGLYASTLAYRDADHGGLSYYINTKGDKVLLTNGQSAPDQSTVYHDGVIIPGVRADGTPNTTVIDAASYYLRTFDWGANAWNQAGAIYDNSYVKMREVVLGYTLPQRLTERLKVQQVRISLVGRNLFYVWRTLQNLDPESTIGTNWLNQGIDDGAGPGMRSYGFSLHFKI